MNLTEVKKQLPHGAIREIAKRAKVNEGLVSKIFNGKIEKSPQEPEIFKATAEYLSEFKAKDKEAKKALQEALTA